MPRYKINELRAMAIECCIQAIEGYVRDIIDSFSEEELNDVEIVVEQI